MRLINQNHIEYTELQRLAVYRLNRCKNNLVENIAATQAGVPVIPVAIRGTRSMLRADSWFPRRGRLEVIIAAPIVPDGDDWAAAVRLRDQARAIILQNCGEVDLEG